jgi:hypothetical protein
MQAFNSFNELVANSCEPGIASLMSDFNADTENADIYRNDGTRCDTSRTGAADERNTLTPQIITAADDMDAAEYAVQRGKKKLAVDHIKADKEITEALRKLNIPG